MLTTFIIGLREGLEAALIVGIVAAFLVQRQRRDAFKAMWLGVALAVAVCITAAGALTIANQRLPLAFREGFEGTLTLLAVAGVSYMLVWMRRHGADLKGDLETRTAGALERDSVKALVVLAFVAVIREGLETSIFLFALLEGSAQKGIGLGGAALGILVAAGLGYAIYRGGTRINLRRFFMVTGVVLVLVAAGLVASAIHEFAEAGLVAFGQGPAIDLTGLVVPGSVQGSLITAFLGFQAVPTYAELFGWALFVIPAMAYLLYPRTPRITPTTHTGKAPA